MSYPPFGKVKTIVLPVPTEELTYSQYKEKYGIDLKDVLELSEGIIFFKSSKSTMILFDVTDIKETYHNQLLNLIPAGSLPVTSSEYAEGSVDGRLDFTILSYDFNEDALLVIGQIFFRIARNVEFSFENMTIVGGEY